MAKFWYLIEVLYQGKSLKNPAKWKNLQTAMNGGLLAVFVALTKLLPDTMHLSDADAYQIAEAAGIIGVMLNGYLTHATSDKIGFKQKR